MASIDAHADAEPGGVAAPDRDTAQSENASPSPAAVPDIAAACASEIADTAGTADKSTPDDGGEAERQAALDRVHVIPTTPSHSSGRENRDRPTDGHTLTNRNCNRNPPI